MAFLSYHAGTSGKVKQPEMRRMINHTFRKSMNKDTNHSNEKIDKSKTNMNIDFISDRYSSDYSSDEIGKLIEDRISKNRKSKKKLRKDAVVAREIVMQISKEDFEGLDIAEQQVTMMHFKQDSEEFLQDEFGEANILGGSIHLDETNPHIHFYMTPLTDDGKLSQKEFFKGPKDLKRQHRTYREHMKSKGWNVEQENKYEGIEFLDMKTYKPNAETVEKKRQEQYKAMMEGNKDILVSAFDEHYQEACREAREQAKRDSEEEYQETIKKAREEALNDFNENQRDDLMKSEYEKVKDEAFKKAQQDIKSYRKTSNDVRKELEEERESLKLGNRIYKYLNKHVKEDMQRGSLESITDNKFSLIRNKETKEIMYLDKMNNKVTRLEDVCEEVFQMENKGFTIDTSDEKTRKFININARVESSKDKTLSREEVFDKSLDSIAQASHQKQIEISKEKDLER